MDNETEMIKHQMEETRSSLSEKLETLENQVMETVQGATSAVTDTVENVKEAVQETVDTVKHTFDLSLQVERHPWAMMAGSVAVGYVGGYLLNRATEGAGDRSFMADARRYQQPESFRESPGSHEAVSDVSRSNGVRPQSSEPAKPSWLSGLGSMFESELGKLRSLAIGTALGMVRDVIQPSVPEQMKSQVKELIDNFTTKLGGEVIEGPILPQMQTDASEASCSYESDAPSNTGRPLGATRW